MPRRRATQGFKESTTPLNPSISGPDFNIRFLAISTLVVLGLALVQALVSISPDIFWDVDPRSELARVPVTVFGPTAVAWINALSVIAAAFAMVAHAKARGSVSWLSII